MDRTLQHGGWARESMGPSESMGVNVGQVLRQWALRDPERVALVCLEDGRSEHDYASLDGDARRVAGALLDAGVRPGERVALSAANGAPFVAAWFGALYAGCSIVPIPILSAQPEIRFRLEHAGCRMLIGDASRRALGGAAAAEAGIPWRSIDALLSSGYEVETPADTSAEEVAMILYTSGTTGSAKGACITHGSLFTHSGALVHHTLGISEQDRVLGVLPITHSYGIRMAVLVPFYAGARSILAPRFDAAASLDAMEREGVSWLPAVPTMFHAFSELPAGPDLARLRWCLSAGAPLADDTRRRAEARLGAEIRQGYGLTEATFTSIDAPPSPAKPGSVGRPVWGVEVRILGPEGEPLNTGEEGEITVRGQNVMSGYLDDLAASQQVTRGGWLHTGDVGRLDDEGRLEVVDRIKDLILRGGNNVYPSEVENALSEHPSISQVAVVGRPDNRYGEEVVAVIVLKGGASLDADELARFARERLARYKIPREVVFTDALPLGPSRKILKREIRRSIECGRLETSPIGRS